MLFVQATLGPNVVSLQPGNTTNSGTTTTPATPAVHQLTPMAQMQVVQPMLGTPQHQLHPQYVHTPLSPMSPMQAQQMMANAQYHSQGHPQQQAQNTIIVPQIVQVPQSPPPQAPQAPIIIQQQQPPQMSQSQIQQMQMHQQQQRPNYHSHPVFNVISSDKAQQNGMTSISHELPSGEKVEISMQLTGQKGQSNVATKTQKKPAIPLSAPRPAPSPQQSNQQSPSRPGSASGAQFVNLKVKKPSTSVQDLVDLFGKKINCNYIYLII